MSSFRWGMTASSTPRNSQLTGKKAGALPVFTSNRACFQLVSTNIPLYFGLSLCSLLQQVRLPYTRWKGIYLAFIWGIVAGSPARGCRVRGHPLCMYAPRWRGVGHPKSARRKGGCVNLVLWFSPKCEQGGGGGPKSRKICVHTWWMVPYEGCTFLNVLYLVRRLCITITVVNDCWLE